MKHLLLVLVTAVTATAEGQICRADLDENRVVDFGDFLLFVNQFNLTPSTGCTPLPIDCRSAVQVAVANQIEESKKELQAWVDAYTSSHDALNESSRVIARKDSVIARLQRAVQDSSAALVKVRRGHAMMLRYFNQADLRLFEAWVLLRRSVADRYVLGQPLDKARACDLINSGMYVHHFDAGRASFYPLTGAWVSAFWAHGLLSSQQYGDFMDDGNNFRRDDLIENSGYNHVPDSSVRRRTHLVRKSWAKYFLTATGKARVKSMLGCE